MGDDVLAAKFSHANAPLADSIIHGEGNALLDRLVCALGFSPNEYWQTVPLSERIGHDVHFSENIDLEKMKISFLMLENACKALGKKTKIGHGYSIELREGFNHRGNDNVFRGSYLTLINWRKKVVGVLKFKVGVPLEVCGVQGQAESKEPAIYSRKTGEHFDVTLMKHFIRCVGRNMHFKKGDTLFSTPLATLSLEYRSYLIWCNEENLKNNGEPKTKILNRLAVYIPDEMRMEFLNNQDRSMLTAPIHNKFFNREWNMVRHEVIANEKPTGLLNRLNTMPLKELFFRRKTTSGQASRQVRPAFQSLS